MKTHKTQITNQKTKEDKQNINKETQIKNKYKHTKQRKTNKNNTA